MNKTTGNGNAVAEGLKTTAQDVEARIIHALEVFPFLSSTMIHMMLGTSTPTSLWKPILNQLIDQQKVIVVERTANTPAGRRQNYSVHCLPTNREVYEKVMTR